MKEKIWGVLEPRSEAVLLLPYSLRVSFPGEPAQWQRLAVVGAQRGARRQAVSSIVLPDGIKHESQP